MPCLASPSGIHLQLALNISSLYRHNSPRVKTNSSSKTLPGGGKHFNLSGGVMTSGPLLRSFHATSITQSELCSLSSLKAWGNHREIQKQGHLPSDLD